MTRFSRSQELVKKISTRGSQRYYWKYILDCDKVKNLDRGLNLRPLATCMVINTGTF